MRQTLLVSTLLVVMVLGGRAEAKFNIVDVNKANQKEIAKDDFTITVKESTENNPSEAVDRVWFTVHIKKDIQRGTIARLWLMDGKKRIATVPVHQEPRKDGDGFDLSFEVTFEMAPKCFLYITKPLEDMPNGTIYRVELGSYVPK